MSNRLPIILYVVTVATAGTALLAYLIPGLAPEAVPAITFLALLCAGAQYMPVSLFASTSVSVALAFSLTAIALAGPAAAVVVNLPSIFVHAVYPKRRPVYKVALNLGLASLSAGTAGLVYQRLGGEPSIQTYLSNAAPMGVAVLCYYFIQCGGVAVALRLTDGGSFRAIWQRNYSWLLVNYLAIGGISLGMALAFRTMGYWGLLVFSSPLVMAWQSFRMYTAKNAEAQLERVRLSHAQRQIHETMFGLPRSVGGGPQATAEAEYSQAELTMRLAAETARHLHLDETVVTTVEMAALLHDLGNIGIPKWILNKPGALTEAEMATVRRHAAQGAQMVQRIGALEGVVPALLHHHERFDGQGYPARMSGPEIPIAAQIVVVVDAYRAMTSDRPYRLAFGHEEAVSQLWRDAGSQFNPAVVEAFVNARETVQRSAEQTARARVLAQTNTSARHQSVTSPLSARLSAVGVKA